MTKVSVFGKTGKCRKVKGKPIELCKFLCADGTFGEVSFKASDWRFITLISRGGHFDVIACGDTLTDPLIYLGHWNDGVVE